ncbi:ArsR family transcriptional regulator [Bacillus coahuilensis m2-6]|uniref:ArsR family transcriptional regulator n=1 Tax=Bacillus coahuilensis p1.1.43 TaxID=1150625 RepID=A0A147KBC7_9BACI|nr:metalloregulator ArsR/SmtB family transcription factor [Bacillus coahuilensis]KUP08278.1 ArsR family transcriptional regulator [Bacillus coahuilensis p1.1.43]KUP09511.1 ArsR family transcriptional regulator [Bacillus coahuilensis m2-6]
MINEQTYVDMEKSAMVLKLLGDKTRLSMVKMLDTNDCCVCEFVAIFNASQPAISQHIRKLKDVGIVKEERKGQWVMFSLNKESKYYPMISSILLHVPDQSDRIKELEEQGLRISCD